MHFIKKKIDEKRKDFEDRLKKNKFNIGKNLFVGYSPEREDPGNETFSTTTIPKS